MGDVLLTTPMARALRERYPQAMIAWLARPYTAPLLEQNPDIDRVLLDHGQPICELAAGLRAEKFDAAFVALPRWRAAAAVWLAGVPQRVGPASKIYSLLFTERVWQHRSHSLKHEADYNLELLGSRGIAGGRWPTRLELRPEETEAARRFLESMRIRFNKPVVVLHPGSGGSSARWPLRSFIKLGDRLQRAGADVVVTGGPGEDYQYLMIDQMDRIPVFVAAGSVSMRELAAILKCADLVVTNSTGPLHMAVALGVRTVSVFSPIPACHPRRWGPYPAYPEGRDDHAVLVAPESSMEAADLASVSIDDVWRACLERLPALAGAGGQ